MNKKINQAKRTVENHLRLCGILMFFLSIWFVSKFIGSGYVMAASDNYGSLWSGTQAKAGKYYYTVVDSDGVYFSNTSGEQGKKILSWNRDGATLYGTIYLSGKYVYYIYDTDALHTFYRMKLDGTNEQKLTTVKKISSHESTRIYVVYNDQYAVFERSRGDLGMEAYNIYSLNVKTKKVKLLSVDGKKANGGLEFKQHNYQSYYVATFPPQVAGNPFPAYIYNAKKQSVKKLTDNACGIAIGGKYVYYIEYTGGSYGKLIRCNVKGKNKKTVCKVKADQYYYTCPVVQEATSKYCIYYSPYKNKYYKYTFSTKKTKVIKYK